jgi:hypothetical protein
MDEFTSNKNGRLRKDKFVYLCNKTQIVLQKKSLIFMSENVGRICAAGVIGPCYVESIVMQTFAQNFCTAECYRRLTSTVAYDVRNRMKFHCFGRNIYAFLNEKFSV